MKKAGTFSRIFSENSAQNWFLKYLSCTHENSFRLTRREKKQKKARGNRLLSHENLKVYVSKFCDSFLVRATSGQRETERERRR